MAEAVVVSSLHSGRLRPKALRDAAKVTELVCAGAGIFLLKGNRDSQKADLLSLSLSLCLCVFHSLWSPGSVPCPVLRRVRGTHSLGKDAPGEPRLLQRPRAQVGPARRWWPRACVLCVPGPAPGSQPLRGESQGRDPVENHTVDGGLFLLKAPAAPGLSFWVRSRRGPQHSGEMAGPVGARQRLPGAGQTRKGGEDYERVRPSGS